MNSLKTLERLSSLPLLQPQHILFIPGDANGGHVSVCDSSCYSDDGHDNDGFGLGSDDDGHDDGGVVSDNVSHDNSD